MACHSLEGLPEAKPALAMKNLRKDRGCLSAKPQGVPDYGLSGFQRKAIGQVLEEGIESPVPERVIKRSLTAFNCIACHQRDDYGGPSPG